MGMASLALQAKQSHELLPWVEGKPKWCVMLWWPWEWPQLEREQAAQGGVLLCGALAFFQMLGSPSTLFTVWLCSHPIAVVNSSYVAIGTPDYDPKVPSKEFRAFLPWSGHNLPSFQQSFIACQMLQPLSQILLELLYPQPLWLCGHPLPTTHSYMVLFP
jgi:hypothetical protein